MGWDVTARTKAGEHGTITLYRFTIDTGCPEFPPYTVTRWAYSLDHAWRRAEEELSDDTSFGERVTSVAVVRE